MTDTLPEGRLQGPKDLAEVVRATFRQAVLRQWREICIADTDFEGWPLGERSVVDDLGRWAMGGGELRLLARDYRPVRLGAPRFVKWRQTFDHRVSPRTLPRSVGDDFRLMVWTPDWVVVMLDRATSTMVATTDAASRSQQRQAWDSTWPLASPGFPASTLGL